MQLDELGNIYFNSTDIIDAIYLGNVDKIKDAKITPHDADYIKYLNFVNDQYLTDWALPEPYIPSNLSMAEFDKKMQENWLMPQDYKDIDIEEHLVSLCESETEVNRVREEIKLFEKHNMMMVLKYLKYLVDIMRENNILWGVGRGSSVSSYCLFLLGIHKIDSIKYQLDIKEFLR